MKFVCDKCNTKYSIADERVHGRVLKIRCKTCDNIVTVREATAPVVAAKPAPAPLPAPAPAARPSMFGFDQGEDRTVVSTGPLPGDDPPPRDDGDDEWYVSFDGDQEGPFALDKAIERVRSERPRGREVHCWKPGFFVWLPVEEVPEFARVVTAKPPASRPAPPIGKSTGSRAALGGNKREPTGSKPPRSSEPTGPKPVIERDPTGPRAALAAVPAPKESPLGGESKPLPLPPPPEPAAANGSVMPVVGGQETRPEPRFRRPGSTTGPAPSLGAKAAAAPDNLPDKLAARPAIPEKKHEPAPEKKNGSTPELSPFAAAMANVTGNAETRQPDTGPVPLPPPPGQELPIGEASGLLNLSHLAASAASTTPLGRTSRPQETFGGMPVTPASGPNGIPIGPAVPNQSAPVVVMTGPAPRHLAPWIKWTAVGGIALSVVLAGALVWVITRPPQTQVKVETPTQPRKVLDDTPIAMDDPGAPPQPGAPVDPKRPNAPASKRTPSVKPPTPGKPDPSLSDAQKKLAALYSDSSDHAVTHAAVKTPESQRPVAEVSQAAIASVVTSNRRALNLCYDRVLKRDSSLKRARLDVHVKIGISGSVVLATPSGDQAAGELGTCIAQTVKHWHFPASDSQYETEFPLVFQAQ